MDKFYYQEKYPHLFEPLVVGKKKKVEFKNRLHVGPMGTAGTGSNPNGTISELGIVYYGAFARGGFASLAVPLEVPKDGGHIGAFSLDDDVNGFLYFHNLQNVIHAYNAKSFCEIYHSGICMLPHPDREIIGPSSMVYNGNQVREMNEDDMEMVTKLYVDAAFQSKRAGFDGLCLHYGHGWLMNNFLSPLSNFRTDKYGGSVENRCRFPRMVIEAIRKEMGDDLIIQLRLNGSDKTPGGITPEDAAEQTLIFEDVVDMIHMSCGTRLDATSRPKMHPTTTAIELLFVNVQMKTIIAFIAR